MLASAGVDDVTTLQAAVLHDVVEDCNVTERELIDAFGAAVATAVVQCSDDKALSKHERKAYCIEKAREGRMGLPAILVTLADKTHNLESMAVDGPPKGWSTARVSAYAGWASEATAPLRHANATLARRLDAALAPFHDASTYEEGDWKHATPAK